MNITAEETEVPKVALVSWKLEEVALYLGITVFILFILLVKYLYHKLKWIASYIPESLILIVIGLVFGAIVWYVPSVAPGLKNIRLTPNLFFNILLPPIVLESAYGLFNRTFADFFVPVMLFAVIGTVLNFLFIGFGMWSIDKLIGLGDPIIDLAVKDYLLFASLIVAVDPVAVLAIFQDIGVDAGLYYMVFGESLLNDAVTVVLYNIMNIFVATEHISTGDILIGVGSFFTVSLGGALIGLCLGILSCLITKLKALSGALPLFLMSHISYMVGDLFGWSGIIAIIVCGVFQAAYAFHNVAYLNIVMLRAGVGQLASICEAVIFLMLGLEIMATNLIWHAGFIITAIVLCLVARTLITFVLSAIINYHRPSHSKIHWSEQVIISYGGLRGAVAFSLAVLINENFHGENGNTARNILITATLLVILFTVAFMGVTMKPLVRLLHIRLAKNTENKLLATLNNSIINQALLYMETLIGEQGSNHFREIMYRLDDKYIRPFLQKNAMSHSQKIVNVYEKYALQFHTEAIESRKMWDDGDAKVDDLQTSDNVKAEPGPSLPSPKLRKLAAFNPLDEVEEDDIFETSVPMNMPKQVRRRVNVASMYQGGESDIYSTHRNTFHKANDAHFAQFSRNQHRLLELLADHINVMAEDKFQKARAMSIDSAMGSPRIDKRRHGKKFSRSHTEVVGYPPQTLTPPSSPGEGEELLSRHQHAGRHHYPRVPRSPKFLPHQTNV
nr:sodium:hydrogen exchanger 2 (nhe2) [Hymenolepis microstoma]